MAGNFQQGCSSILYETNLQFHKHEGCILALNFTLTHEAKGKTKAWCDSWTRWRRHRGGWSQTSLSLHQQTTGSGLSGLPAGTCQSCYEWSLLAGFGNSASAVKQMLPCSITNSIWRCRLLGFGVQSCRALGLRMMCMSVQPAGLGWGNLLGWKAQRCPRHLGITKITTFCGCLGGFSCSGSEGLVDDESLNPMLCSHWVLHCLHLLCSDFWGSSYVTLPKNTALASDVFSLFNCEASNFLIKYQVLLNTARIVPDRNVVN